MEELKEQGASLVLTLYTTQTRHSLEIKPVCTQLDSVETTSRKQPVTKKPQRRKTHIKCQTVPSTANKTCQGGGDSLLKSVEKSGSSEAVAAVKSGHLQ